MTTAGPPVPVTEPRHPQSADEVADRALRQLGWRVAVLYLGYAVAIWLVPVTQPSAPARLAVTVLAIVTGFAAVHTRERTSPVSLAVLAAATFVTPLVVSAALRPPVPTAAVVLLASMTTAGPAVVTLAVGIRPGLVVLLMGHAGLWLSSAPRDDILAAGPATTVAICAVVRHFVVRGARVTAVELAARDEALQAYAMASDTARARRSADRLLHDTVLSTLSVLAHGGAGVDPDQLRSECRRDLDLLDGSPDPPVSSRPARASHDARPEWEAVAADAIRTGVTVRVHVADGVPPCPPGLDAAVRECLRNVGRHAGIDAADLIVAVADDELTVLVVDRGAGFDSGAVPPTSVGLAQSVRGRVEDLGGSVRIWSAPGVGTTVMLRVPRHERRPLPAP